MGRPGNNTEIMINPTFARQKHQHKYHKPRCLSRNGSRALGMLLLSVKLFAVVFQPTPFPSSMSLASMLPIAAQQALELPGVCTV